MVENGHENAHCVLKDTPVTVIGGGAAGLTFALEAARQGASVTLFERNAELLNETSRKTPGRMTSGFHYMHLPTALTCLITIIKLIRKYPGFRRGEEPGKELPEDHPMRRGRYFILKKSNVPKEEILATYNALQKEYERLIVEDPQNKVFGDKLFHLLEPHEYANHVDIDQVDVGIETREHLMNFERFRDYLLEHIKEYDITVKTQHELVDVKEGPAGSFNLVFKNHRNKDGNDEFVEHQASYVANATWSDIELINQKAGFPMAISHNSPELFNPRTNRLKVLAKINLPESLRNAHHMFFCMGPEGSMFSNNGDGTGFITHAHITNIASSTGLDLNDIAISDDTFTLSVNVIRNGKIDTEKRIVVINIDGKEIILKFRDEIETQDNKVKVVDIIQALNKITFDFEKRELIEDSNNIKVVYRTNANNEEKVWNVLDLNHDQNVTVRQGYTVREILRGKLPENKQKELGQKLIDGIATRIPAMKEAVLVGLNFGIVQTEGEYNPNDPDSDYNKRDYYGLFEDQIGWMRIAGVKLMFTTFAAELGYGLLYQQEQANVTINNAATKIGLDNGTRNAFLAVARHIMTSYELDLPDIVMKPEVSFNEGGELTTRFSRDEKGKLITAKIERDKEGNPLKQPAFRTLRETAARHEIVVKELQRKFDLFGKSHASFFSGLPSEGNMLMNDAAGVLPTFTRYSNNR